MKNSFVEKKFNTDILHVQESKNDFIFFNKISLEQRRIHKVNLESKKVPNAINNYQVEIINSSDNSMVTEDSLNEQNNILINNQSEYLSHVLKFTSYESGFESDAEKIVREMRKKNEWQAYLIVNKCYLSNFGNSYVLMGILHLISHFNYDEVKDSYQSIAIGLMNHCDNNVKEMAIQCFENWDDIATLETLENIESGVPWLQNYINQVIEDKKEYFGVA